MPSELLHFPPAYTVVGLYRLLTDPSIRTPVLNKVRHASIRGIIVGLAYAAGSWKILDWFIRRFLIGGGGSFFGLGRGRVGDAVKESVGGMVQVGIGRFSFNVDLVFCKSTTAYHGECLAYERYAHLDSFASNIIYTAVLRVQEFTPGSFARIRPHRLIKTQTSRVLVTGR
jgi:hypothetical protein